MYRTFRNGQNGALMDVYEIAIKQFQSVIKKIPTDIYRKEFSKESLNSIERIVQHVIYDGYVYANYYRKRFKEEYADNIDIKYFSPEEAVESLNKMFQYSIDTLVNKWDIGDAEMMNTLIKTSWSIYDLEALWEHAIVHIYRHRRQICKVLHMHFEM